MPDIDDATACAEAIRAKRVSPRELVDESIRRIERDNVDLGAVIVPLFDDARALADRGGIAGPFRGVPFLLKDICATMEGVLQTSGLLPLKRANYRAPHDSHLVTKFREAGFIIVGKTNTSELGILPSAESPAWPPSRNPHDLTRSTGGSSGGSAAATAAGVVPIAHANDGGGSIRIPASCCGLFGLKPSRARVSLGPDAGDYNGGLVNEHVVTRSVRDSAAVLDAIAGMANGDPYTAPPIARPYREEVGADPGRLRIGFATRHISTLQEQAGQLVESHPDCVAAVHHTAELLEALGHHVEPAELSALHDPEWVPRFLSIWVVGVAHEIEDAKRTIGRDIAPHEVERLTWALSELGKLIPAHAYVDAWRWLHRQARTIDAFWNTYDLWLTPTITEPPVPLGTFLSPPDDPLAGIFRAGAYAPFTAPFNATGQPACSIPLYHDAAGLPIGTQLVARYGREDVLFRIAAQLEAAQPFRHLATR